MPRIRTVKPEFWGSPDVAAMSYLTRLVFIGMWNFAEDNGVGHGDDRALRSQLFPMDDVAETSAIVRRALSELSSGGQIELFEVRGRRLYKINGWRHQKIDKPNPNPRYRTPEEYGSEAVSCGDNPFGESSANDPRTFDESSIPRARARQDQVGDLVKEGIGSSAASRVDLTSAREDQRGRGRRGPEPSDLAQRAVREFTPRGTDAGTRRHLGQHCDEARTDGASWSAIENGLIAWSKHPKCTAGLLPSLITDAVKVENGARHTTRDGTDSKTAGWAAVRDELAARHNAAQIIQLPGSAS